MLWIAVLLLPLLSVMLVVMDRVEDRLLSPAPRKRRRAGRRRHLRLVREAVSAVEPAPEESPARAA